MTRYCFAPLLALMVVPIADGALVAYDPFLIGDNRAAGQYSVSTDMRTMGAAAFGWVGTMGVDGFGVPHAGSTSNFQANATGEDSAAVSYEQGGRLAWLGSNNSVFNRNLTRQLNPTPASSTWWFSIMTNRLGWGPSASFIGNQYAVGGFTDASNSGLQVGYDDTAGNDIPDLVLRAGGVNTVLLADAPSSDNQFVIVKLDVNTSGNDTISVWTDPSTVSPLGAPSLVLNSFNVSDSLTPFTQSRYESPAQSGVTYWDEIRLATDLPSLIGVPVPEPASCVLMACAAAGLAVVRRK
ncbi:hypothetical protein Pla175_21830 [Pirellulimonas nuda]|uniref:PEP-CTERM protein-sorting domain-containing protein n=1 Tax=Pirellulimonas nuda TaxID=2528009 RepID=A0A518DBE9_9BACT|nr:hypothetical protein [Pirellulimonas nuda]QDU88799.1 hypothetical protein Pla175_21830 [Pirellulimonas nuda]